MKKPHTALFVGQTGCGKTEKALCLLETEYRDNFDFIVIISPTLKYNVTYTRRKWFWKDPNITLIEPCGNLYEWIEQLGGMYAGWKTLFLIDDIIADASLDRKRQSLLELAISGRHKKHSLWLLTQSYTAIPKNIRRQIKMLYVWYPKDKKDLGVIYDENDVVESKEELINIKSKLKEGKHTCFIMRMEHPRAYDIC